MTPLRHRRTLLGAVAAAAASATLMLAACDTSTSRMPAVQVPGGNPARGNQLMVSYGCGSCHTVAGVAGANGKVGPPLTGFRERSYIAGELVNNADNLQRWVRNPQAVEPGTAMPNLGVTSTDARDIAAYLLSEGS